MIEYRALKLFLLLAEERHFGRAGERLGLSQSAVSAQILRLEDQVETRLVNRGRRAAVTLTRAGETFLGEAKLALAQIERARAVGQMAGRGEAGPANIGFVLSAALSGSLTSTLSAIRLGLPGLRISAEPMETPEQIAAVSEGRLDLGLIRPRSSYPDNVDGRIILREAMLVGLPAGHRLAGRDRIAPADLLGETLIYPEFGGDAEGFRDAAVALSRSGGFTPDAAITTHDFVTAISLAAAGYGIALTPRSMTRIGMEGIMFRPLDGHTEEVELAVIWSRGTSPRLLEIILAETSPD